ncbi:hypothetical protein [Singulisphaera acidiphila]|uniref:Uncharacterized protein n=1 Tax=Singulisphaera acidiphila (strain ATCC BAA-1392 / DSM 18658 / VKM B-2454 / MOB10) TaxID=886293 RepID=L0DBW5_SINAD|nr:hypothetical protein [Singulisphaera acidiphila]AGA26328.1 hypothetical protein Sinac_1971 [Singulisphaera acidiphila DSM 18658]
MTRSQLDGAVAQATGESLLTVRRLGFSLMNCGSNSPDPEDLCLVIDCPFCSRPVPHPDPARDGSPTLAECLACDVYFDYAPAEIYAGQRASSVARSS